jgi:hypothetical protein
MSPDAETISEGILLALEKIFFYSVIAVLILGILWWLASLPGRIAEGLNSVLRYERDTHTLRDWAIGGAVALVFVIALVLMSKFSH